jgi:enoyl-[acyl-carrier protein] reductase / trans-2-enoyl-CoA reductase (NAD+)
MELEVFKKLPLGGVDRRQLVSVLASDGLRVARELVEKQRPTLRPAGARVAKDTAVLILGGSNGITRAVALQLLFAEDAAVVGVHYDSEKMQIGAFHVQAITEAATAAGKTARFFNEDATRPQTIETVVAELKQNYRAVHFINGIANGATKRYAEHGPTQVKDVDVAFDPVLQVPDFSKPESIRKVGLVEVEVASDVDIERTNKFMGTSSLLWAEALAGAGLLARNESVVAFCDYDYPADDPVYAMGPLAGAKQLQRKSMQDVAARFGVKTSRLCYPPMATTALGTIPGGSLMYALSAEILREEGKYQTLRDLAAATMPIFHPEYDSRDIRMDTAYQACLPEFHRRKDQLTSANLPGCFSKLYGQET